MASSWIHTTLAEHGYKHTAPRDAVIKTLIKTKGLFSTNDIIKKTPGVDRVSIYRTLELLTTLDVIHPVSSEQGEQRYELHTPDKHEHHIVCTNCDKTEKVRCNIPKLILKGFTHVHHSLALTGICRTCAKHV